MFRKGSNKAGQDGGGQESAEDFRGGGRERATLTFRAANILQTSVPTPDGALQPNMQHKPVKKHRAGAERRREGVPIRLERRQKGGNTQESRDWRARGQYSIENV